MSAAPALETGLVVASHGRHVWVEKPDGGRVLCHPRGKKAACVVGDQVQWLASTDEGTIERVVPRRNLFYRRDEIRTKSFAANLDQILVLIAAEPEFSERQLARALIAAEAERIDVLIVLNKSDVQPAFDRAWARLAPYRDAGYTCLRTCLRPDKAPVGAAPDIVGMQSTLREQLAGKATLVLGPSGAGKSSLINALLPDAQVLTAEISQALNSGKHTTTSTSWYWVDRGAGTAVIDSPGFQEFGLHHIDPTRLAECMPDLRAHLGECRFHNCMHLHEPGCGVRAALASEDATLERAGQINAQRYRIYSELFAELNAPPSY